MAALIAHPSRTAGPTPDEWNNLMPQPWEHIPIAILIIGVVGLLIEKAMTSIANRFDYRMK